MMKRMICLAYALLLVPALASAQPKTPDEWYKEGETHYNLGNFQEAITAFKQAFALETVDSKKSAYLYNIAQSYRFAKDCSNAQFFYKRFLALRDTDKSKPLAADKRAEIEARIKELEECARQQEAIKNKPPDNLKPDEQDGKSGNGTGTGTKTDPKNGKGPDVAAKDPDETIEGDGEDKPGISKTVEGPPKLISMRLVGGGAKLTMGALDVPIQATGALIAGYPISIDKLVVELGAGFTFTPVPFENMATNESKTAQLIGLVANVGATYAVIPKLGLRADLGVGALFFGGVSESPFTAGAPTSGALSMLHLRVGVSADYAITPNFIATLTPIAFSYSPAKEGLQEDITAIKALDFMVGLGYRM
jgi:tetratricopeptide (TPR) repeat protein